jgi:tetratricopeptide (TPR) repeat protein
MINAMRAGVGPALFILTLLIFSRAISADFLNYDDPDYVTRLPEVRDGLKSATARWALSATHAANWHPLTWWSLQLDASIYGLNPAGFHTTNILLHAGSVWLLYTLLQSSTSAWLPSACAAAVFGWHPLRAESVAWVAERKDVLSVFFGLLSLLAYARFVAQRNWTMYLLATVSFALSLLAKPMLVSLPLLMLLLDYWPLHRTAGRRATSWKSLVLEKIPWLLMSFASGWITWQVQARSGAVRSFDLVPPSVRIARAIVSYVAYLVEFLWPHDLAVFYPYPHLSWHQMTVWFSLFVLLAIWGAAWKLRRRCPYLWVGWLWYAVSALPIIGLVQVGNQSTADRYTYLPAVGLSLAVSWLVLIATQSNPQWQKVMGAAMTTWILSLVSLTWQQLGYWHDSVALWRQAARVVGPNSTVELNLGTALAAKHEIDEACRHLLRALRMNPTENDARVALEVTVCQLASPMEAEKALQGALRTEPTNPFARYALGFLRQTLDQTASAVNEYRKGLEFCPDWWPLHQRLASCLKALGQEKEARQHDADAERLKLTVQR